MKTGRHFSSRYDAEKYGNLVGRNTGIVIAIVLVVMYLQNCSPLCYKSTVVLAVAAVIFGTLFGGYLMGINWDCWEKKRQKLMLQGTPSQQAFEQLAG